VARAQENKYKTRGKSGPSDPVLGRPCRKRWELFSDKMRSALKLMMPLSRRPSQGLICL
jgi:hypothetical protein